MPEWLGPPDNVLPGAFPLSAVVVRTDRGAVSVNGGLAYPAGFTFTLAVRLREPSDGHGPLHRWHMANELDDETLRFGIRFADGSKATIFDGRRHFASEERPTGPVLLPRGGGGGGGAWDNGFWVWPLPPPGPLAFVAEWPAYGVELTDVEIDSAPIREAAGRSETLWPQADGPRPSGGTRHYRRRIG